MKRLLLIFIVVIGCTASKTGDEAPSPTLSKMVEQKQFQIVSHWANPQYTAAMSQLQGMGLSSSNSIGGRMDIHGITNYLTIINDSVSASLPYYGERQMSSSSGSIDQGIVFNGIINDLESEQKGSAYILKFKISNSKVKSEHYDVRLKLNSNLFCTIDIMSSHRSNIRYEGRVSQLSTIQ